MVAGLARNKLEKSATELPRWKDDCKDPQVYPKGHEGVPFHFEQQTKAVSQKETRRRRARSVSH